MTNREKQSSLNGGRRHRSYPCYICREFVPSVLGGWYCWGNMQVHLCPSCEKESRVRPERGLKAAA